MEIKGRSITIEGVENVRRLVEALVGGDVEAAVDLEIGEQVVVCLNVFGRGRESGAETNARIGHLYTLEGEKITRLRVYDDRDEAEQAARDEAR